MSLPTGPRLAHAAICVPSLEAALELYAGLLEQDQIFEGRVSRHEALAWQAPASAGARSVVLQPPSGDRVFLRLIEQAAPIAGYQPGTHFGWSALELSVASADRIHERLVAAGTPIIAPPKMMSFTDKLYPMQARGPGGEAIYLNEVRGNLPSSDLPVARCWVDRLFIAVVGCAARSRTLDFYNALLRTQTGGTWAFEYNVLNAAFGLPAGTMHTLSTLVDGRNVLLEADQYPPMATPKPVPEGGLAPGVLHIGVWVSAPPGRVSWLAPPAARREPPYFGAMVGAVRGPDGELCELLW